MECKIFNRSTMAPTVNDTEITKMNKTSVRFKEVALYFSEEEWSVLEPWQKELYNNVMRDIHTTLVSLGYTILHRNVLCRIRKIQELHISSQKEDGNKYPSMGASVISPDIILRIKHDEELSGGEEEPANTSPKSSEEPGRFPKVVNMKEEDCEKESERPFSASECLSNTFKKSNIKDVQDEEKNSSLMTSEANHLVFNPKFSIWIKQVDEQSEGVVREETHTTCTAAGNVNKVKTEKDCSSDPDKLLPHQGFTELFSNKENSLEKQPKPPTSYVLSKPDNPGKGEESLLSIVLKRANAGSPYMPNCKYSNGYKGLEYGRGVPRLPEREICYGSKQPVFQRPSGSELLSGLHIRGIPPYHVPQQTDKPFTCHICQKSFKTLGILNVHMKTHTGVRPYQCNECGKSFRDNWNLKVHQKIHTGETPYKCSICEKGFIQYATYMKHQRIHTGEKPYSCCYCDKSFTNSSNLVRHHRTHTGEKPYTCQECGKSFSYNTSLIQHKRTHRSESVEIPATDTSSK